MINLASEALKGFGSDYEPIVIMQLSWSTGADGFVAKGIESLADLKGKKIGLEEGFVEHLLFLTGVEQAGLDPAEFELVNTPTDETPQVLAAGAVSAVAAWQPNSGQALKAVDGSKPIFTSADAPGIIYDLLFVDAESLEKRRGDW